MWVDWSDVIEVTPAYGKLRENRHLFMSSKLAFTTTGYATAQLKRIKSRKKHASFLPDLNRLCELLLFCFEEGTINREWVINHCGEKVFNYFLEKYDINESDTIGEIEDSLLSVSHLVRYAYCEDLTYEALNVICKPKQTEFIKMVQNLIDEKVLKFDFYSWHQGYQLVPFGNDIFGIYKKEKKRTFTDTFEIIQFFGHDKREDYPKEDLLFIVKYNEKKYKEAQHAYKMFWNWYENRNETRLEMEKEFGFDLKNAMHLVRLMRIGEEALITGQFNVKRKDAEELLSIRNGAWTFEEIIEYANYMDDLIINKLYKETKLQKSPDVNGIANLLMEVQDMIWL